jgi:hypothetical protein
MVAVVERERFVACRRDAKREARHECVEHFVPLRLRLQVIKIANGEGDGGHGCFLAMFFAQEVVSG